MLDKFKAQRNPINFDSSQPGLFELAKRSLKSWLKWILLINLFFFTLFTRITGIYSGSMTPTVQTNEVVCCSPLSYGFTPINFGLSFKDWHLKTLSIKPKQGDVVAFFDKHNYNMVFSKRILGCPGDKIKYSNGILIINGKPVELNYIANYTYMENEQVINSDLYEEVLPNNLKHNVCFYYDFGYNFQDNTPEFTVPEGNYFVSGDNRNNSLDSRCEIGFIKEKNIIGKVYLILFSNGNLLTLNIWKFITSLRPDRCLKWVL